MYVLHKKKVKKNYQVQIYQMTNSVRTFISNNNCTPILIIVS